MFKKWESLLGRFDESESRCNLIKLGSCYNPYNLIGFHSPESSSKVEYEVAKGLSQGLAGVVH